MPKHLLSEDERESLTFPLHQFTLREVSGILSNAVDMRNNYCRYYPAALTYIERYRQEKLTLRNTKSLYVTALTDEEIQMRIDASIAAGFFILTPPVMLYLMAIDANMVMDTISSMARFPGNSQGACLQTSLLTSILVGQTCENVTSGHESFLRDIGNRLPLPSVYRTRLVEMSVENLEGRLPKRTLH